jgi:hypothetical protein
MYGADLYRYLYHEKRIALVNNFVYLVPLKNIVQGRISISSMKNKITVVFFGYDILKSLKIGYYILKISCSKNG